MKVPYSQGTAMLASPCPACGYERGLIIVRFKDDPGFIRCAFCDSALYSVRDRQAEVRA